MSDDSNEWDESTAYERVDREDTNVIIAVLHNRRDTTICRSASEIERLTKVALLRDLAAELDEGFTRRGIARMDAAGFVDELRERADALEGRCRVCEGMQRTASDLLPEENRRAIRCSKHALEKGTPP